MEPPSAPLAVRAVLQKLGVKVGSHSNPRQQCFRECIAAAPTKCQRVRFRRCAESCQVAPFILFLLCDNLQDRLVFSQGDTVLKQYFLSSCPLSLHRCPSDLCRTSHSLHNSFLLLESTFRRQWHLLIVPLCFVWPGSCRQSNTPTWQQSIEVLSRAEGLYRRTARSSRAVING